MPDEKHSFVRIAIYWVFTSFIAFVLGLGWLSKFPVLTLPVRRFLFDLHVSLGLTAALLILAFCFLRGLFLLFHFAGDGQEKARILGDRFFPLLFVSFVLMVLSGFSRALCQAQPIPFWTTPLPIQMTTDVLLADIFGALHKYMAYALAALILAYAAIAIRNSIRRPRLVPDLGPIPEAPISEERAAPAGAGTIARGLAYKISIFGQVSFWSQFLLAFITAPLLAIGASGHTISPGSVGFGETDWGIIGLGLLLIGATLAFYFKRAAKKIVANEAHYIGVESSGAALWFLGAGTFTGILGVLSSFMGVGSSILLLIAKTVSQPPGIAITNPARIVRALDVMLLMVNSNLLVAHFIGVGIAVWLSTNAMRARQAYHKAFTALQNS
ncbi:MAG TPA: DUF3611 family protein [Methylocella sp.]|nr:DUF3611 family protein [Methylocella sp.]